MCVLCKLVLMQVRCCWQTSGRFKDGKNYLKGQPQLANNDAALQIPRYIVQLA